MSRGRDSERMAKGGSCPPKARQYQSRLVQGGEIKPRRAAYDDGLTIQLTPIGAAPAREFRSPYSLEAGQSAYSL
jgi:hypothetical protein